MPCLLRPWGHMHYRDHGLGPNGTILWANSLGTDLRMWQEVCALLPGYRHIGFDKRGHGLSATPTADWDVVDLASDAIALLDHLNVRSAIVGGCSVGGMVAQAIAIGHPARVRALILSNTAAKIGTAEGWQDRIASLRAGGIASIADTILDRWFPAAFRHSDDAKPWGTMLLRTDLGGYIGTCAALSRADFRAGLGGLTLPVLLIAGSEDMSTPPNLVAETASQIAGAHIVLLQGSGHIPAIDAPKATAEAIATFLKGLPDV